jgi:hypothetical protein
MRGARAAKKRDVTSRAVPLGRPHARASREGYAAS